jgi:hypothetical protein
MTRHLLGPWLTSRHRPTEPQTRTRASSGWQPLPEDVAEWMGAKPYLVEELEESA